MSIHGREEVRAEPLSVQTVSGAAVALFTGTSVSKVLGFARDVLIASLFGASATMDAFFVALSIPSIIGYAVGSGLASAILPVSTRLQRSAPERHKTLNRTLMVFATLFSAAVAVMVVIASRPLVGLIAPDLPGQISDAAISMTRLLSVLIIAYVLYYLMGGIYHSLNHFVVPSFLQPLENVIVIIFLASLHAAFGIKALVAATVLGLCGIVAANIVPLLRTGELSGGRQAVQKETWEVLRSAAPLVAVFGVHQGYFLIERYFASGLPAGSIASLTYARRLIDLPTLFFIATLASALFPKLSDLFARNDRVAINGMLSKAASRMLVVLVPITIVYLFWGGSIVSLVFHRGAFDSDAVRSTSDALRFYSVGIFPLAGIALTSKALYAMNNMRVPFIASMTGVMVSIIANVLLRPVLGISGIALSTTLMFLSICLLQAAYLWNRDMIQERGAVVRTSLRSLLTAGLSLAIAKLILRGQVGEWEGVPVFLCSYAVLSLALLRDETREIRSILSRLWEWRVGRPVPSGPAGRRRSESSDHFPSSPNSRILLLADATSAHTLRWVSSLSEKGIPLALFSLTRPANDADILKTVRMYTMGFLPDRVNTGGGSVKKLCYLAALIKLRKAVREFRPDIVHAHYASSYGLLGALAGFHPFVLSVWGSDVFDFPRRSFLHRMILKANFARADRILSTSQAMADEVRRYTGKEVHVTPFGIDLDKFRPTADTGMFLPDDIVIGTIKKLESIYGIEYLIRAFAILKGRNPGLPLKLLIVGGGVLERSLPELARQLRLERDVVFTGAVPHDAVARYHNMISIFAALSLEESFGVSILEASACSRPVVVTRIGGLPEVVSEGRTGFLVRPRDPGDAAQALERLVLDAHLRKRMGDAGREHVRRSFPWNASVELMIAHYEHLLGHGKRSD